MSPLLAQIVAELRFSHMASLHYTPLSFDRPLWPTYCSFILADSTSLDVRIWHTKDPGLRGAATVLFGRGFPPSLPSPDARASSFSLSDPQRPWSAAVHDALPRCDVVRSDPSCAVHLQTGPDLLASVPSPLNAACPCRCCSQAGLTLGLAITGIPEGPERRDCSPVSLSPLSLEWHLALTCPPKGDCPLREQSDPPTSHWLAHLPRQFPSPLPLSPRSPSYYPSHLTPSRRRSSAAERTTCRHPSGH
ncbi:hypothetical protein J3F83DRAFT_744951 [Trichoderma novae-zelandiae]